MALAPDPAPPKAADPPRAPDPPKDNDQQVEIIALGSFFENHDFTGRLLQAGDTARVDRQRAAELRANGLIRYTDKKLEETATATDLPDVTDQGETVITTRSLRRPK
jgi:hypothetical protein